jgi:uncharacterized protein with FMN-binding domain
MKLKVNYFVDVTMLVGFFACAITGVLKFPELNVQMSDGAYLAITTVHDWTGIASLALAAVHVLLHAKWFANATKTIFAPKKKVSSGDAVEPAAKNAVPARARLSKSAVALIALLLVVPLGSAAYAHGMRPSNATVPQGITYAAGTLKDGTYTGSATGYMPGLTVEVTVKSGMIKSVEIVSSNETPRWLTRVETSVPASIVKAQGTEIDTVSGATSSSEGIMSAVENALANAKK